MAALWSAETGPFESSVWSGSAIRSSHDSLSFLRRCRQSWSVDRCREIAVTASSSMVAVFVTSFDPFSNNRAPATAVFRKQFNPAVWADACEFQVTRANILEAQPAVYCFASRNGPDYARLLGIEHDHASTKHVAFSHKHRHAKRAIVIFLVIGVFVELFTVMIWLSFFALRSTARRKLEIYNLYIQRYIGNGKIAK